MDKLLAGLQSIGVNVDTSADPFDPSKLAKIINNECNKFCADDTEDSKKMYFVEYMYKRLKEKYPDSPGSINKIYSGLIAGCKKYYKTTREMRLYLQVLEKDSFGTKKSCICYMRLRKYLFEAIGRKNEHDIPLQGIKVPPHVVEGFAQKIGLDINAAKAEIVALKADINSLDGPEFSLACMKVYNKSAAAPVANVADTPKQAIDFGTLENLEKYKKVTFVERVYSDRENNIDVLSDVLFKLYSDPRFNSKIISAVTGKL
jgi:hypothetical protein